MKLHNAKANDTRKLTTMNRFKHDKNTSSLNYYQDRQKDLFHGFISRLYQEESTRPVKIYNIPKRRKRSNKNKAEEKPNSSSNPNTNSLNIESLENPLVNQQLKSFVIPGNFEIDADRSIFGNHPPLDKLDNMNDINQAIGSYIKNVEKKRDQDSRELQMSYSDHSFDTKDRINFSKNKNTSYNQEENYGGQNENSFMFMKRKSMEKSFRK